MATPSRRRRLVIEESPSSESSFSTNDDGTTLSSEDEENEHSTENVNSQFTDGLTASMSQVKLSDDAPTKNQPSGSRACARGGINSLAFDSESEESDSSIESYVPTFKPKATSRPIVVADSDATDSDDDESIDVEYSDSRNSEEEESFQSPKQDFSSSSEDENEDNPDAKWSYNRAREEFSVASTADINMPKLTVPTKVFKKLFDYQKDGVVWMAGLHHGRIGGLLGDDMGLGKTFQTLTLLGGLMRAKTIRNALVVAPLSVLRSWEREANAVAKACVPHIRIQVVSSDISKATRSRRLQDALECSSDNPNLVITTYGLVRSSTMDFISKRSKWDYIVLDEAHNIKNPSAELSKCCRRIARHEDTRRVILTGTPIMNNLKELWALIDFANSGKVLGPLSRFTNCFAKPIEDARNIDATSHEIRIGERANKELQGKLRPYFLQRSKIDFLADKLPTKSDYVIWVGLSEEQRALYSEYVESKESAVAHVLTGMATSPLEAVTWLKKLCGHPILVDGRDSEILINRTSVDKLKLQSSKLHALSKLVEHLRDQGHRLLIFSQSTKMLDIIERVLCSVRLSRIDGSTKEKDRQRRVDEFNSSHGRTEVMLLSTKAAGVGLTLTGADRAIVYDPSWNPAEDSQAVDRCYRIGQKKEVSVFRFITAGSVEEKMYEKQVHKDGIRRAVMTSMGSSTTRYFDKGELRKLFMLGPKGKCEFLDRLKDRGLASDDDMTKSRMVAHSDIIGVSSHDNVYKSIVTISEDEVNDETTENPFSTAHTPPPPSHYEKSQNAGTGNKALGRSQRALFKGTGIRTSNEKNKQGPNILKRPISEKENRTNAAIPSTASNAQNGQSFAHKIIRHADNLCEAGHRVGGLEVLMDLLEGKHFQLEKHEKIQLHERIASEAHELQWF